MIALYKDLATSQFYFGRKLENNDIEIFNWDYSKTIIPYYFESLVQPVAQVSFGLSAINALCLSTKRLGVSLPFFLRNAINEQKTRTQIVNSLSISPGTLSQLWPLFGLENDWKNLTRTKKYKFKESV